MHQVPNRPGLSSPNPGRNEQQRRRRTTARRLRCRSLLDKRTKCHDTSSSRAPDRPGSLLESSNPPIDQYPSSESPIAGHVVATIMPDPAQLRQSDRPTKHHGSPGPTGVTDTSPAVPRYRVSSSSSLNSSSSGSSAGSSHSTGPGLIHSSNLLLLGLALCCLTVCPPVEPRQNHHQTCPGCPHQQQQHQHVHEPHRSPGPKDNQAPSPDDLRLEAIKHQILTKLGLRTRPDVNRTLATVPRHLALETLYRAEAQSSTRYHPDTGRNEHRQDYGEFLYGGDEYSYRNLDQRGQESSTEGNNQRLGGNSYGDDDHHSGGQESQEEMDDFYARTSEIITFAEPGRTLNGQPLLEFPMSSGEPALEPLRIKRATLWARVELRHAHHYQHHRQGQTNQRNITLWVFRVRCGNATHLRGKELGHHLEMVTSLGVNVGQLGWQKFDVTRVVGNWYASNGNPARDKLTLLVDCTGCGSHVYVSTFDGHTPHVLDSSVNSKGAEDPDRPFLVVRTDPAAMKRVRRRAVECSGAIKGQCCKQRFYVNFSQLGWDDWIIAPQGYYANYCRGDCAAGHRTPDTFLNYYTHVIEEYRKMDRLAGMQPCCAPLKFSPMSLIYYGPDSNIIKRDLPKMVVDECGCP